MRIGILTVLVLSSLAACVAFVPDARADAWTTPDPAARDGAAFDRTVASVRTRCGGDPVPACRGGRRPRGPYRSVPAFVDRPTYFLFGFDLKGCRLGCQKPADQDRIQRYVRWVQRTTPAGWLAAGALTAGAATMLAAADVEDVESVGDWTQIILPASAYLATFGAHDPVGRQQFTKAFLLSQATVQVLKHSIDEWRPNASDAKSFPSGHTSAAFLGAAFLYERYGPVYGIPAYVVAGYTGLSRVWAEKHFFDDVLAGASISLLSTWLFTTPRGAECLEDCWRARCPTWRYEWETGFLWQTENLFRAPNASGTTLDFADYDHVSNPAVVNRVSIEYFPARRHELMLRLAPGEIQDYTTFASPVTFGDTVFAPGVETRTRYLAYEYRLRYRYDLVPSGPWHAKVGASVSIDDFTAELDNGTQHESVHDFTVFPLVHAHVGYELNRRWRLFLEADAIVLADDRSLDGVGAVRYRFNPWWEVGLGYRFWFYRTDTDKLYNRGDAQTVVLQIAYQR